MSWKGGVSVKSLYDRLCYVYIRIANESLKVSWWVRVSIGRRSGGEPIYRRAGDKPDSFTYEMVKEYEVYSQSDGRPVYLRSDL